MKPGASDPFADDEETESAAEAEAAEQETAGSETVDAPTNAEAATSDSSDADGSDASTESRNGGTDTSEFPYIYRRDKVKDERPDVHQLFVRDETDTLARDAERDLEKLLGEDVYRLDAREAIYLAGMRHLDEAADVLREWGYDR
ncbi:hypothetical protein [Halarchaeum nitratireducens]|uniref:Uncharacterized protein n=1 Tax=Halarchaeum nitratireducens TaxID=489913 RepID=A0A830GAF5_9EURY|nr:hypothetical protein [Halarchaeum nitratireducens]GGN10484.1 hypothetical protein GCM10009021_07890 [Halarchaeum nitratireducens]